MRFERVCAVGGRGLRSWVATPLTACVALILVAAGPRVSSSAASAGSARGLASARPVVAPEAGPIRDVFGIHIGTLESEAHRRLARLGTRVEEKGEEEEGEAGVERELWELKGSALRFVAMAVNAQHRVIALQAYARPGAHRVRYRDLGDLAAAKRLGYYIYEWAIPASGETPALRIEARGTDAEYLGSFSIARDRRGARAEGEGTGD